MQTVLFICTGNSARSQLAEAMLRHMAGDRFRVFSAGVKPKSVDPMALELLAANGISTLGLHSKSLDQIPLDECDLVVTLCSEASRECADIPVHLSHLHWELPAPKGDENTYRRCIEMLQDLLQLLIRLNPALQENALTPASFFKSLTDHTRLRIMMLLEDEGELCVCELVEALQESQPKISRHLAQLRSSSVLGDRRQGQWIFYRLHDDLPTWAKHVVTSTRIGNPTLINQEKQRLKQMGERPERVLSYCAE